MIKNLLLGGMIRSFLLSALFIFCATVACASVWVGKITDGRQEQWITTGQWAVVVGDNSKLRVSWHPEERAYYVVVEGSDLAAGTDGRIPPMRVRFGGASNQLWVETRWVN